MPRTKQKRGGKSQESHSAECEQAIRNFTRLATLKIQQVEREGRSLIEKYDGMFEMSLSHFPTEIQNMTLRELMTVDVSPKKENLPPKTPRTVAKPSASELKSRLPRSTSKHTATKRTTTASDDGYQSESTSSQASNRLGPPGAKKLRRSRSVTQERKSRLAVAASAQKKKEVLRTPQSKTNNSFVITPKIKFNSAVNVLRKPKDGEMVFSTQGSPLLVSTTVNEKTANINVPLQNGQVVSLLPFHDSSLTENFLLDEETKHQLKILQHHLAKVLD